MKNFNVLAMDPSITAWGYAVSDLNGEILEVGCIKTSKQNKKRKIRAGDDDIRRIEEIVSILLLVIETYNIKYIVTEQPHGSQNSDAAKVVGMVNGVCVTINLILQIPIEYYLEADAKRCLFNRKEVTKSETMHLIDKLYKVPWTGFKYKDEAIADAIAIHFTALKQSNTLKIIKS